MRILQITDLHVLPHEGAEIYGTDTFQSLRSVMQAAMSLRMPPEIIVATGDLSEDGSKQSYQRLREVFEETRIPVYVIPGNHDSVSEIQETLLGETIQMVSMISLEFWKIAFLDSTVSGKPHGYLESSELDILKSALVEEPGHAVVACLHHGPIAPCPSTGCHLRNAGSLIDLLQGHANARVVLAGHAHVELSHEDGHITFLTTPAASSQCTHAQFGDDVDHEDFWESHKFDPARHGFRILDLHENGEFETEVHWVHRASAA